MMTENIALTDNPLAWILDNIRDDISGVEEVVVTYTAEEILEPALEYIEEAFKEVRLPLPDRKLIISGINDLIETEKKLLGNSL